LVVFSSFLVGVMVLLVLFQLFVIVFLFFWIRKVIKHEPPSDEDIEEVIEEA
jgi:hypothetical protein